MGMQRLVKDQVRWSTPIALATGVFTLALGLGLTILFGQANRATLGLASLPSLTLLLVGLRARGRLSPRLVLPGLALLLFADLASFAMTMMRFVPPLDAFADGETVASYLADQPGLFRTYSPSYSLPSPVAAQAGLQTADGVEPVHLAAYDRLMALAGGYGDATFSVTIPPFPPDRPLTEAFQGMQPDLRLLGLLNVEYLAVAFPMHWPGLTPVAEVEGTFVYRNKYALPRAWVVHPPLADAVRSDASHTPFGALRRDADLSDDWSEQLTALTDLATQTTVTGDYVATVTRYEPNRFEIEARLPKPGLLVVSEIWYPGWQVLVDGELQPVEQVAHILRGVYLNAGTHRVAFEYAPASVRWGMRLSLVGIVTLMGWGGFWLWRRRQTQPVRDR
jgi:hypothetical protein